MSQMKQGILCEKDLHNGQVYRTVTNSELLGGDVKMCRSLPLPVATYCQ